MPFPHFSRQIHRMWRKWTTFVDNLWIMWIKPFKTSYFAGITVYKLLITLWTLWITQGISP